MSYSECAEIIMGLETNPMRFLQANNINLMLPNLYRIPIVQGANKNDFIRTFDFYQDNYFCPALCDKETCIYKGRLDPEGSLVAYFLPWEIDTGTYIILEEDADIMLTPLLTGCSFSFSRSQEGSQVRVSHQNIKGADANDLEESAAFTGHTAVHSYNKKDRAVIGVLDKSGSSNRWNFYVQTYKPFRSGSCSKVIDDVYVL